MPRSRFRRYAALVAVMLAAPAALGEDGTWTNPAGGSWTTASNWAGGVIANDWFYTADFSTLDLSANATVSLNGARTISRLAFGDANPSHDWTLATGSGGPLTLAASPEIEVKNRTATVSAVVAGTSGLSKTGPGTLVLSAINNYTGDTYVQEGTMRLAANSGNSGTLRGTLNIYPGAAVIASAVNALGYSGNNWVRSITVQEGGSFTTTANGDQGWGLTVTLRGGTLSATGTGTRFSAGGGTTFNAGDSATTSVISGQIQLRENNTNNLVHFGVGEGDAHPDLDFTGFITSTTAGRGIQKGGNGTMRITGTNSMTGPANVNEGTLVVDGTLTATTIPVSVVATLAGSGTVSGPVNVQGTLAPGDRGLGTLRFTGALTLSSGSTTRIELAKAGTTLSSDRIQGGTSLALGGTLAVTTAGDPLQTGDSFTILSAGQITGSFATLNLPALPGGLNWDTTLLSSQGKLTVTKASQAITFDPLAEVTLGDAPFALNGTASSGLTVSFASSDPAVATVEGNVVTLVGSGYTTITATQAGDSAYFPAPEVTRVLTVNKATREPQTIAFAPLADVTRTTPPFVLTAASDSGLPVSYTSSHPAVASVSGNTVTVVGAGTTTITARQAGNTDFLPAAEVSRELTVTGTPQTITFAPLVPQTLGNRPIPLAATATSGLAVAFASSDPAVATVNGSTLTLTGAGTATITASQPGNDLYDPAGPVARTLTVVATSPAPSVQPDPVAVTLASGEMKAFQLRFTHTGSAAVDSSLQLPANPPLPLSALPLAFTTAPGAESVVEMTANAVGKPPGSHTAALTATHAGTAAPVTIPLSLQVTDPLDIVAPQAIAHTTLLGGAAVTKAVSITPADGVPRSFRALVTDSAPWLTLEADTDIAPAELRLRIDPAVQRFRGTYTTNVRISIGQSEYHVPVRLEIALLSPKRIVADPIRPRAYALNPGTTIGQVHVLDDTTAAVTDIIPVGFDPVAADFSPDGRHLYVHCHGGGTIERIDLETKQVTGSHRFDTAVTATTTSQMGLAAGADGVVHFTTRDHALRSVDFESGTVLSTLTDRKVAALSTDRAGQRLFALQREPSFQQQSVSTAFEYQVTAGVPAFVRQFTQDVEGTTRTATALMKSWADERAYGHFHRYDLATGTATAMLPAPQWFEDPISVTSVSNDGKLLTLTDGLYDPKGRRLSPFGRLYFHSAINHRTDRVIAFRTTGYEALEIPAGLRPPVGLPATLPVHGGSVSPSGSGLSWTPPPFARSFRVFLGTDEAAVRSAVAGSPLEIALTSGNRLDLPAGLPTGTPVWWRVDFLRGDTWQTGAAKTFQIIDAGVSPAALELRVPAGMLPQSRTLRVATTAGAPLAWAASSDQPWLVVPAAGSGDLPVEVRPATLATGVHRGTVRVTAAGAVLEVPVTLDVYPLSLVKLDKDPQTPGVAHGLHQASATGTVFMTFRASDGSPMSAVALPRAAGDLAVHPHDGRVYFSDGTTAVQVLDLPTLTLLTDVVVEHPATRIEAGAAGRIIVESDPFRRWLLADSATGATLWKSGETQVGGGDGEADDAGTTYWRHEYVGGYRFARYDLSAGTPALIGSGVVSGGGSGSPRAAANGTRAFMLTGSHDAEARLVARLGENALATDSRGDIAVGANAIMWSQTGQDISRFSDTTSLAMVSPDDRYLLRYDTTAKKLVSTLLAGIVSLPAPHPQPGSYLRVAPDRLEAPPATGALSYRFFLGTSASAVGSATPGSPLELGSSASGIWNFAQPLTAGASYFWRVDTVTASGTVTGQVWRFDIPFPMGPAWPGTAGTPSLLAFGESAIALVRGGASPTLAVAGFDTATGSIAASAPDVTAFTFGTPASLAFTAPTTLSLSDLSASYPAVATNGLRTASLQANGRWLPKQFTPSPAITSPVTFGRSASGDGHLLLIGDPGDDNSGTSRKGEVRVYHEQMSMVPLATFQPTDGYVGDLFGHRVALSGNVAVVSAVDEPSWSNGTERVYFFERAPATGQWSQKSRINRPSVTQGLFGAAVAIEGDLAVVGSPADGFSEQGGDVFVYVRQAAGTWTALATLRGSSATGASPRFGAAVAVTGDLVLVADPSSVGSPGSHGQIFPFRRSGSVFTALPPLRAPSATSNFGLVLAARDGWLVAGDPTNNGGTTPRGPWLFRLESQPAGGPRLTTPALDAIGAGKELDFPVTATSPAGGVTFEVLAKPAWMSATPDGAGTLRLTGTVGAAAGDMVEVQLRIRDANGRTIHRLWRPRVLGAADAPAITATPELHPMVIGHDLALRVAVTGAAPLSYQWEKDGLPLAGETGPVLHFEEIEPDDAGEYVLRVTNAAGSAVTPPRRIEVSEPGRFVGDWPTFGGSARHAGFHPARLGRHRFQPVWQREVHPGALVQRAALADGMAFVVPQIGNTGGVSVQALRLSDGAVQWSHAVPSASSMNPPTWHDGRVYFQRGNGAGVAPQLISLHAADGTREWSGAYEMQSSAYEAPAADFSGIYVNGGRFGGLYGFNPDGTQRFFRSLPQFDQWTPGLYRDRLFSWVGTGFHEHDRADGNVLASLAVDSTPTYYSMRTIPALGGKRAVLIAAAGLHCVDVDDFRLVWKSPDAGYTGSPALQGDRVHALQGSRVRTFSLADGSEGPSYETSSDTPLVGQPVVFHDHLAVASESRTWVFSRSDGALVQTLTGGGRLSYADGYLLAAGADGIVRAFFANAAPEFTPDMPAAIAAGDAAGDRSMFLGAFFHEADPDDSPLWAIESMSNTELFRSIGIDPFNGILNVKYNPWTSGESDVVVSVTDTAGNVIRQTIRFSLPALPEPDLLVAATVTLNRQTGLYEHRITVTNAAAREVAGFDLAITGLPAGVTVNNASASNGGTWTIHHRQPLAAGASVTLLVEYFSPTRGTVIDPEVAVVLVVQPETDPAAGEAGLAVDRCQMLADQALLIEFTATPGALYEIQYSDNATDWKVSPVNVRAAGNRVQWIDRGPPRTDSPPSDKSSRFYRVREITTP